MWVLLQLDSGAVQRANAHYYISAGWTPPYTHAGEMKGEQWTRTTGDGDGESRKEGGKKAMIEGTEAWLTLIRA